MGDNVFDFAECMNKMKDYPTQSVIQLRKENKELKKQIEKLKLELSLKK